MIVTLDIGNTNISMGRHSKDSDEIINYANFKTEKDVTTDDIAIKLDTTFRLWKAENEPIDSVIISSVVPPLKYPFKHIFSKYYGIEPHFVGTSDVPVIWNYDYIGEIGADRIVNAYAGMVLYPNTNLIIVDFGTATNFDVVTAKGEYEGGVIVPGILISLRSLEDKAAKLPPVDLSSVSEVVGKTTVNAIRSGILHGSGAMVDELSRRIAEEMNWDDYLVISTGGLSELIKPTSKLIRNFDRHLTLKGLYYIWKLIYG